MEELHITQGEAMYEQIYHFYADKIAYGEYKPGDKLPTYKLLSDKFSVSISTVKRAYKMLESDGSIILTKKGSFVLESNASPAVTLAERLENVIESAEKFGASHIDISSAIEIIVEKYC